MIGNVLTARILKKQREIELEKQRELELEKQRELELEKQRELELEKQRELELEKQRELELEKQRELELEKQRELELEKQRELELQKQRELELEKQREIKLEKQRELELEKQRELELEKQRELELEKQRELQLEKQRELELRNLKKIELQKELELQKIDQGTLLLNTFLKGINDICNLQYFNIHSIFSNDITKQIINALNTKLINNSINNNIFKIIYKTFETNNNISYENFNETNINEKSKIIISNHLSLADTFLILNKINNNTFTIGGKLAFDILFKIINVNNTIFENTILEMFKVILYDKDEKEHNDIKHQMLTKIQQGSNILIYPEGDYSELKTHIKSFYSGSFKLAYDNKIPIMPIVLYYNNNNHLYKYNYQSLTQKALDFFVTHKYSGNIIVHHCNDGNDILPLLNETFEEFKERIHNIMQTELTELNKKHNNPNFKPL